LVADVVVDDGGGNGVMMTVAMLRCVGVEW
jgi:hypothetical protein